MGRDKFPMWIIGVLAFISGIFMNTFTSGVKVGDSMRILENIGARVEAAEVINKSQESTIIRNANKIDNMEKAIENLQRMAEIGRKENREEHVSMNETLKQILRAVR